MTIKDVLILERTAARFRKMFNRIEEHEQAIDIATRRKDADTIDHHTEQIVRLKRRIRSTDMVAELNAAIASDRARIGNLEDFEKIPLYADVDSSVDPDVGTFRKREEILHTNYLHALRELRRHRATKPKYKGGTQKRKAVITDKKLAILQSLKRKQAS